MYRVPDLPSDVENTYCVIMAILVVGFFKGDTKLKDFCLIINILKGNN